jgi:hypothetical protein
MYEAKAAATDSEEVAKRDDSVNPTKYDSLTFQDLMPAYHVQ